jgi:hypothetical protein
MLSSTAPAFQDVDAVQHLVAAGAGCAARWCSAGSNPLGQHLAQRLLRGSAIQPDHGQVDGLDVSRLVCASKVLISSCWPMRLLLGSTPGARRRLCWIRRARHPAPPARVALSLVLLQTQRFFAGLDLGVGQLFDFFQHALALTPCGNSVTTSCHWPRARSSIFQRARTFSCRGRCDRPRQCRWRC